MAKEVGDSEGISPSRDAAIRESSARLLEALRLFHPNGHLNVRLVGATGAAAALAVATALAVTLGPKG